MEWEELYLASDGLANIVSFMINLVQLKRIAEIGGRAMYLSYGAGHGCVMIKVECISSHTIL
jgi:hypothetical protein